MSTGAVICCCAIVFLVGFVIGHYVTEWSNSPSVEDKYDVLYKLRRIRDKLDDISHHVSVELLYQALCKSSGKCDGSMTMHRELKRCENDLKYVKSILNQLLCDVDK